MRKNAGHNEHVGKPEALGLAGDIAGLRLVSSLQPERRIRLPRAVQFQAATLPQRWRLNKTRVKRGVHHASAVEPGPSRGDVVLLRQRQYLVEGVVQPPREGDDYLHRLVCLDDDAQGREVSVIWRHELFAKARRSILVAGFRFDHGKTLLEPLHRVMRDHSVQCSVFADQAEAEVFIAREWPFGPPFPDVYFDAREEKYSSVHAKCVVIDSRDVFITSANFTDRGQRRNVEVGVLNSDEQLAERLTQQWHSLVASGAFRHVSSETKA
jgi:hypothetical protein